MARTWSLQQAAIFTWFREGLLAGLLVRDLLVRARAGTGKTTTILAGIDQAPDAKILLAAFNKRIAVELTERLKNPRAEAKTLHSAGYGVVRRYWEHVRLDDARDADLAREVCGLDTPDAIVRLVTKLAMRAKDSLPFPKPDTLEALAEEIEAVPEEEWSDDGYDVAWVARHAAKQMERSRQKDGPAGRISFADMVYLPVVNGWAKPRYDLVVIDEAQDMSASQLLLARMLCKGRLCIVGDDRQAIYGFRGADSGSMDRMKAELQAGELGLTVTYRCPKPVVAYASTIVPDFTAAPSAPDVPEVPPVDEILPASLPAEAGPGDFVLSRKNGPLAGACLSILRAGKKARIEGRDIGAGLVAIVRKIKAKSVPDFIARLEGWRERECKRAAERKNPEARISLVTDQAETLLALTEGMASVSEIVTRIESLFTDTGSPDSIVCSTVHKAKGLEADHVFLLADTFKSGHIEEENLRYVAATRAKKHLTWVVAQLTPAAAPLPAAPETVKAGDTVTLASGEKAIVVTAATCGGEFVPLEFGLPSVLGADHDCDACEFCRRERCARCGTSAPRCSHGLVERHGVLAEVR